MVELPSIEMIHMFTFFLAKLDILRLEQFGPAFKSLKIKYIYFYTNLM